jgi:hypothetical protein
LKPHLERLCLVHAKLALAKKQKLFVRLLILANVPFVAFL